MAATAIADTRCELCDGVTGYSDVPGQVKCKRVSVCRQNFEVEEHPPTPFTDRTCECILGQTFAAQARPDQGDIAPVGGPTVCEHVHTCSLATEEELLPPTLTSDRVCVATNAFGHVPVVFSELDFNTLGNHASFAALVVATAKDVLHEDTGDRFADIIVRATLYRGSVVALLVLSDGKAAPFVIAAVQDGRFTFAWPEGGAAVTGGFPPGHGPCPAGMSGRYGFEPCTPCPKAQYAAADRTTCLACPSGTSTDGPGAASASNCTALAAGSSRSGGLQSSGVVTGVVVGVLVFGLVIGAIVGYMVRKRMKVALAAFTDGAQPSDGSIVRHQDVRTEFVNPAWVGGAADGPATAWSHLGVRSGQRVAEDDEGVPSFSNPGYGRGPPQGGEPIYDAAAPPTDDPLYEMLPALQSGVAAQRPPITSNFGYQAAPSSTAVGAETTMYQQLPGGIMPDKGEPRRAC